MMGSRPLQADRCTHSRSMWRDSARVDRPCPSENPSEAQRSTAAASFTDRRIPRRVVDRRDSDLGPTGRSAGWDRTVYAPHVTPARSSDPPRSTRSAPRPSTWWSSAAASPAPAWPSTPPSAGLRTALIERDDFASGTSSKSSKLVHGGLRYLQQGEIGLVYEALAERQRLLDNAPHLVKLLPFLIPMFGKGGVIPAKIARLLGMAMWGYDLTGGFRIGKLHERVTKDEALAYLPTLPDDNLVSATSTTTPRPTTPGWCSPCCAPRRTTTARSIANRRRGRRLDQGRRRRVDGRRGRGRRRALHRSGARSVVNAAGVWSDDVRALDEGTAPRLDPAGQGHPHHGAAATGAQRDRRRHPRPQGPAVGLRRAAGRASPTSARPTPTTTARSTTRSAPPRTSTTCCGRSTASCITEITTRRHRRHLGRPAPAGEGGGERPHRRPVPQAQGARAPARDWSRSPAASSRPTARWPRTPSTRSSPTSSPATAASDGIGRSRTKKLRLRGAAGYDTLGLGRGRSTRAWRRRCSSTSPTATAARHASLMASIQADPTSAEPLVAGPAVHPGRGGVRRAPRDGPLGRRRAVAPHPGPAVRPGRLRRRGRRRRRPHRRRARLGRRRTSERASRRTAPRSSTNAIAAGPAGDPPRPALLDPTRSPAIQTSEAPATTH